MINLTDLSFDEWLDFVFDHPVAIGISDAWHFQDEWSYISSESSLIYRLENLFINSASLVDKYSLEQLNQGFWFIPSSNGFMWSILSDNVAMEDRKKCIFSIYDLFNNLFCRYEELNVSAYMWWDSFFSYCSFKEKNLSTEIDIFEQIILTIANIMQIGNQLSIDSSIHGIDHIIKMYRVTNSKKIHDLLVSTFDLKQLGLKLN